MDFRGVQKERRERAGRRVGRRGRLPGLRGRRRPSAVDWCAGTGSFASVAQRYGFHTVTVDSDPALQPTHCVDALTVTAANLVK